MITTTEAARIAEVTPSTIKRWADQGLLPVLRTAGGHRRFDRGDIERLVRLQHRESDAGDPLINEWIRHLVDGERHELDSALLAARARLGSWHRVADELGQVFAEMGRLWVEGELSIAREHVASNALTRALARICDALPTRSDGPVAVLACPDQEDHTLALHLVELCFCEQGWRPLWLGRRTPLHEIAHLVREEEIRVVALSASAYYSDREALAAVVEELAPLCGFHRTDLLLGGSGPWPDAPGAAVRLTTFAALNAWLARGT